MSQSGEPFDPHYQWLGIPPEEQPPNHYRLLGIRLFEENREVIQNASDRQMVHLRTFQNGPRAAQSQKLLNEVAAAKLCLLSPAKKAAYDARLPDPHARSAGPPLPASVGPAPETPVNFFCGTSPGTLPVGPSRRRSSSGRSRHRFWLFPPLLSIVAVAGAVTAWQWFDRRSTGDHLLLAWPRAEREEASLRIDGQPFDIERGAANESVTELAFVLSPGRHRVQIDRHGYHSIDETVELAAGVPAHMTVTFAIKPGKRVSSQTAPTTGRLVLRWPETARSGANLEIDGRSIDLTRSAAKASPDTYEATLPPGQHVLRIVLASGKTMDRTFELVRDQRLELDVAGSTTPEPARIVLQWPASELQSLREKYKKTYEQLDEYQRWAAEKDEEKKRELLKFLLAKMESESTKLPDKSPQQWVAYDESIGLALASSEFVQARNMLQGTVGVALFSEAERQEREELIWGAALKSVRLEAMMDYLKLCSSTGRLPSEQEQSMVVDRLSNAPEIAVDVSAIVDRVKELQDLKVLTEEAATKAWVAIYVKATQGELGTLERALDLSEKILAAVPAVFESGLSDAAEQVNALRDAVSLVRRKMPKETGANDAARLRMAQLAEGIKQVRDWESLFGRVRAARQTIADGQASPTDHKLIGFWLLQLGRCSDALPYLRESADEALVQLAGPLPEAAKDLVTLADNVEREAKKSKYSRREEEALRTYVRYLRQTALKKNDTSLPPAERDALRKKRSAADIERHESYNRRFPKDK